MLIAVVKLALSQLLPTPPPSTAPIDRRGMTWEKCRRLGRKVRKTAPWTVMTKMRAHFNLRTHYDGILVRKWVSKYKKNFFFYLFHFWRLLNIYYECYSWAYLVNFISHKRSCDYFTAFNVKKYKKIVEDAMVKKSKHTSEKLRKL